MKNSKQFELNCFEDFWEELILKVLIIHHITTSGKKYHSLYLWMQTSVQGNSEATIGTEEPKFLSTLKLKRTLSEREKEKKKSPVPCTIHTYCRQPHRRNESFETET